DRRALVRGESTLGLERTIIRPDGSTVAVRGNMVPLRSAAGDVIGGVISFTDVTDRVRAEQALRPSEAHFRALVENSPDAVALLEGSGRLTYLSPAVERLFGHSPESLLGTVGFELIHPDDLAMALGQFAKCQANPSQVVRTVTRARRGSGDYRRF